MTDPSIQPLIDSIYHDLLPQLQIKSESSHDPVVVYAVPSAWHLLGTGNYAAVVYHRDYPDQVVKIYAPGRPGWAEEVEVYHRLGSHPAYSECLYADKHFLVLKRLHGTTLYDCVQQGIYIPTQVIQDIDEALAIARARGLCPHDVHGRNVMMWKGRGLVVDISDFLHQQECSAWDDLKRAYYWIYRPLFSWLRVRIPYGVLDLVRTSYRRYCNIRQHIFQRISDQ